MPAPHAGAPSRATKRSAQIPSGEPDPDLGAADTGGRSNRHRGAADTGRWYPGQIPLGIPAERPRVATHRGVEPCRPRGGGHGKDPGREFAIFPDDSPAGGGLLRGNPHLIHKKETGNETSELRGLPCRPPAARCAGLIKPASLPAGERNSRRQSLHGAGGNGDGATSLTRPHGVSPSPVRPVNRRA